MSSDIIKNPNRKKKQTVKVSKYVPEWVRLGKEPNVREISPSDAMFLNNNKKITSMKPQQTLQSQSAANKPVNRNVSAEQISAQPIEIKKQSITESVKLPQQVKVSVGQNKNWFEGTAEEEARVASETISYDDIPIPQDSSFDVDDEEFEDNAEEVEEKDVESVDVLQPGEYGVIVKGEVVLRTSILSEAESMIERILFDQLPEFSQVGIEDIALIKRYPLKVGILAILE